MRQGNVCSDPLHSARRIAFSRYYGLFPESGASSAHTIIPATAVPAMRGTAGRPRESGIDGGFRGRRTG
ncbi:MAG: hypothetical protein CVT73_12975, partial [Alphaproteobacteria bacterium HGW-Alphaproteobacteria-12]